MTKREAAIISAYTGIMLGSFSDTHKYAEEVMGRPLFTNQFAQNSICEELKEKSKPDFIKICENITE